MIVNCVAYEDGKKVADIPVSEIRNYTSRPNSFVWLGRGTDLAGVPNAVVLMAVLYAGMYLVLTRTAFGRYVYAVRLRASMNPRRSTVLVSRTFVVR